MNIDEVRETINELKSSNIDDDFIKVKLLELDVEESLIDQVLSEHQSKHSKILDKTIDFLSDYFYIYMSVFFVLFLAYWFVFDLTSFFVIIPTLFIFLLYGFAIGGIITLYISHFKHSNFEKEQNFKLNFSIGLLLSAYFIFFKIPVFIVDIFLTAGLIYVLLTMFYDLTWEEAYPLILIMMIFVGVMSLVLNFLLVTAINIFLIYL